MNKALVQIIKDQSTLKNIAFKLVNLVKCKL